MRAGHTSAAGATSRGTPNAMRLATSAAAINHRRMCGRHRPSTLCLRSYLPSDSLCCRNSPRARPPPPPCPIRVQDAIASLERQSGALDEDEGGLAGRVRRKEAELVRARRRLESLATARPAFQEENDRLETELATGACAELDGVEFVRATK